LYADWESANPLVKGGYGGQAEATRAVTRKGIEIEEKTLFAARKAPFIRDIRRKAYRKDPTRVGRRRTNIRPLYIYSYFCLLCGDDEYSTVPATNAQQIINHAQAHERELITVWRRPSDGAYFSDHFSGAERASVAPPWRAANSTYQFIRNVFPSANVVAATDDHGGKLRCKNPSCVFEIKPKNGLQQTRCRTVFYGALRNHETKCTWDPICLEAENEGGPPPKGDETDTEGDSSVLS
jgi:hypothetical protein